MQASPLTLQARSAVLFLVLICAVPLSAAVYEVPTDAAMIDRSKAIVVGTVTFTQGQFLDDGRIGTEIKISIDDVLKGAIGVGESLSVHNLGGVVGNRAMFVSDGPSFQPGERVLLLLDTNSKEQWTTYGMALGKFTFVTDLKGRRLLARGLHGNDIFGWDSEGNPHRERPRPEAEFLQYVREVVANPPARRRVVISTPVLDVSAPVVDAWEPGGSSLRQQSDSHFPPSAYTQGNFRWERFDKGLSVTFFTSGTQPGYDAPGAAQRALSAWTNDPGSNIQYSLGGARTGTFTEDSINTIVFNSSTDVPAGAIGYAQWFADGQHDYKGERFWSISEGDVVMRSNLSISQAAFDEAVTHELGHTLGFRHSNDRAPATTDAVMNSTVTGRYGASLAAWDRDAATHVYGSGAIPPACTPPAITIQPASTTINSGGTTTLTVGGTGTPPFTFQWYIGISGDTSSPITGATTNTLSVAPTTTTSYWVRLGNACGFANSSTATVTVVPAPPPPLRARGDLNGDGRSDILLRNMASGNNFAWLMNGATVSGSGALPPMTDLRWQVAGTGDFDADGKADIVWRHSVTGANHVWLMDGTTVKLAAAIPELADTAWLLRGVGDLDGDGRADLVWRSYVSGGNYVWFMNGASVRASAPIQPLPDTAWDIRGVADFDADGKADILFRNYVSGSNYIWLMNANAVKASGPVPGMTDVSWEVGGTADFDADGRADIVWRNRNTGANAVWLMNGATIKNSGLIPSLSTDWVLSAVGDFDGNGRNDLFFRNRNTGQNAIWFMNGVAVSSTAFTTTLADTSWQVVAPR